MRSLLLVGFVLLTAVVLAPPASATACWQDPVGPYCEGQLPAGDRSICWRAGVLSAHGTGAEARWC